MAKSYGDGTTVTNTNSHANVAGTTYQNVGGDYILDGAVETGNHMTGHIAGGIKATSRQDTATYKGKQTNAGINLDVDLVKNGTGSSLSLNGGRNKVNADYAAVTEQTGLQYQLSDVVVDGKSSFKAAYFTTATPEDNKTQFKNGVEVSDIQNHTEYQADGVSVGLSAGVDKVTGNMRSPGISGIGYGKDGDSKTSTTYGAVTGMAGKSEVTTETVASLNEPLRNTFDAGQVSAELANQTQITQAFGQEAPKMVGDYAGQKQLELINAGKTEEAEKWGEGGIYRVALHTAVSALGTGSIEGAVAGGGTAFVIPKVDKYLKNQGYDEDTRKAVLVGLSAGIGATTGEVSGVANNVNQTENNYLTHKQMDEWVKDVLACGKDKDCIERKNKFWTIQSEIQQEDLINICVTNYNRAGCDSFRKEYSDALLNYHPKLEKILGAGGRTGAYESSSNAVFQVQQIDNPQAEQIWLNASKHNPNNTLIDNIGWEMAQSQADKTSILGGGLSKTKVPAKGTGVHNNINSSSSNKIPQNKNNQNAYNKFPQDPNELTKVLGVNPKISTTQHGTTRMVWEPNSNTRIRYESHPGDAGVFNPRHHGEHYHIEIKPSHLTWGQAKRQNQIQKVTPANYQPGHGTGFLPNESHPNK